MALPRNPSDRVGTTLDGRYALESILGEGGTATVYAATDLRLGGWCAVKILHSRHPTAVRRMEREARVVASLQHPNVCLVTDFGKIDELTPYLVMERLVGRELSEWLHEEKKLPVEDTVEIAQQTLSVLHVAHARGFVHRDIKPENIFLVEVPGRPPLVKVLDFGVASDDCEQGLTDRGSLVGTPSYMSPEQAAGYSDIDGRTDVYACAVVMYECLTGRQPYHSHNKIELLELIIRGGAPPVSSLRPDVPATISHAVERAMRVEREARFPHALDFVDMLSGRIDLPHETWDMSTAPVLAQVEDPRLHSFEDSTERFVRPRRR